MAVENTQNCQRSRVWRSIDGTDQYIAGTFDDGLARTVSSFQFFRHRCHGGTVQLQLYSDDSFTTLAYDSSALDVINVIPDDDNDWGIDPYGFGSNDPFLLDAPYWLYLPPTATLSYKITFAGNVATFGASYWQVCRLFLGNYFEVAKNPAFGATLGFIDQTDSNRSRGASLRTNVGPIWRTMGMDMNYIREDQRAMWLDIVRYCGTGRDFILSLFPEDGTRLERDHFVNAKFSALNAIGRPVKVLTTKLQIEEV